MDYSKFNATNEVQTPLCSARDYYEYQKMVAEAAKAQGYMNPPDSSTDSTQVSYKRSNSFPEGATISSKSTGQTSLEPTPETPLLPSENNATTEC